MLAYCYFSARFEELLAEEPAARCRAEGVHRMRVATRRIRAALRAFKGILPAAPRKAFNRDVKWVARVLGDVRDLDVYRDDLQHYSAELAAEDAACLSDYQEHLAEQRHQARKELLACLSSHRYQQLRHRWAQFLQRRPIMSKLEKLSIRDAATRIIGKQYKRVLRDGRAITRHSPDDALHELRIDAKRLRYSFEIFQLVCGESLKPFIKRLKELQDTLGEFQDGRVATESLRQYANSVPMRAANRCELIALGQLLCVQLRRVTEARRLSQDVETLRS